MLYVSADLLYSYEVYDYHVSITVLGRDIPSSDVVFDALSVRRYGIDLI